VSAATDALAAGAVQLAEALSDSAANPADAIRLLLPLADFAPDIIPASGPLAQRIAASQVAIAQVLRAAACAALGNAVRA